MPLLLAYGINRFSHDVAHINAQVINILPTNPDDYDCLTED